MASRGGVLILKYNLFFLPLMVAVGVQAAQSPPCMVGRTKQLEINNEEVLDMKDNSPDQHHARAHVIGPLTQVYPDHSGHSHFEIQIGQDADDRIEIIYNEDFGPLPDFPPGASVEACGDYVTARKPSPHGPASPDGAIIHWVHRSPHARHESGYLVVNGVIYGQDVVDAGPKGRRKRR